MNLLLRTPKIIGREDLISYHNDGKGRTMMGKGRESLSEYSGTYIDMRGDNLLISAEPDVGQSRWPCAWPHI